VWFEGNEKGIVCIILVFLGVGGRGREECFEVGERGGILRLGEERMATESTTPSSQCLNGNSPITQLMPVFKRDNERNFAERYPDINVYSWPIQMTNLRI